MSKPTNDEIQDITQADALVLEKILDLKEHDDWLTLSPATRKRIERIERGLMNHIIKLMNPQSKQPRKPAKTATPATATVVPLPPGLQVTENAVSKRSKR